MFSIGVNIIITFGSVFTIHEWYHGGLEQKINRNDSVSLWCPCVSFIATWLANNMQSATWIQTSRSMIYIHTSQLLLKPFDTHFFQTLGWRGKLALKPVDKSFGRGEKWDKDGFKYQRRIARGIDFVRKNETETWLQYWSLVVLQNCERPSRVVYGKKGGNHNAKWLA